MKDTREYFKDTLRKLRKAKWPSQADFAESLGMSTRGYQKYEQGEAIPDLNMIVRLSETLGCSPQDLIAPANASTKSDLLTRLYAVLPTLDELELRTILNIAEGPSDEDSGITFGPGFLTKKSK